MDSYKNTFENLFIRKEAKQIFITLYKKLNESTFRDYFFKDQILRSALSISNNIAEWQERQTEKEFARFLYIAKWSAGETRNMLLIGKDLWYFNDEEYKIALEQINKISWGLHNLIKHQFAI